MEPRLGDQPVHPGPPPQVPAEQLVDSSLAASAASLVKSQDGGNHMQLRDEARRWLPGVLGGVAGSAWMIYFENRTGLTYWESLGLLVVVTCLAFSLVWLARRSRQGAGDDELLP